MKEHKTLRIDMAFPEHQEKVLTKMLDEGWKIIDKTVQNERYLFYVLTNNYDPDLGKCSYDEPHSIPRI